MSRPGFLEGHDLNTLNGIASDRAKWKEFSNIVYEAAQAEKSI